MYDIITTESEDTAVNQAVNSVIQGNVGVITSPNGHYRFITPSNTLLEGNGGQDQEVLVIVGHGSGDSLSGFKVWSRYKDDFKTQDLDWKTKKIVYILACSTASDEQQAYLGYKNFAETVKKDFPEATVWAASSSVSSQTLLGNWQKVEL
ncbi:hypothetical protein [Nostoc sp. 2RC]|uniref:hypothetical protein n=1 Tax=Nostoc sp. 2RC TaxID=2485484 RepID=UPI0016256905|nr:hypothetical protein [Nostoc sp. 2RC]MBC1239128.1 hypothetical protein [Nostoc sp. 2RC]